MREAHTSLINMTIPLGDPRRLPVATTKPRGLWRHRIQIRITSNWFLEKNPLYWPLMAKWNFLTNHARVLVCIAHDPGVRLRDIAATLEITERSAYGIVTDLTEGGYVVKEKDGRRNRYQIQTHLPLREATTQERTIGEILDLLVDTGTRKRKRRNAG